jgi:DNA-binding transcriptional ArsR family regulator
LDEVEAPPATENPPADVATAIDRYDLAILKALDDQSPRIMFQADIEAAASVPRRTIGKRLSALRDQGLICRPRGKRGETITDRGREIFQAAMKGHGK